jgi:hypothetical protein
LPLDLISDLNPHVCDLTDVLYQSDREYTRLKWH